LNQEDCWLLGARPLPATQKSFVEGLQMSHTPKSGPEVETKGRFIKTNLS